MKKTLFTLCLVFIVGLLSYGQEEIEYYTAKFVPEAKQPVIDGTIESVWDNVQLVHIGKVPENENITEPNPDAGDYYAEWGMAWNKTGMFVIFAITDDNIVIEDDNSTLNAQPNDQWWTDDNINLLFSRDLFFDDWEQFEFAWQPGIDQEEKLSSDDWLNAALIPEELVESAWYNDGDLWILETWISWEAFGNGDYELYEDDYFYCEARARDDDDGGTWESMFQWSTTNYGVESDGTGMGEVTLSAEDITASVKNPNSALTSTYISQGFGKANLVFNLDQPENVTVSVYTLTGKTIEVIDLDNLNVGSHRVPLEGHAKTSGIYMVKVDAGDESSVVKWIKR